MDKSARSNMDRLEQIAKEDGAYSAMLRENMALERRYEQLLRAMDPKDRDVVCDFLSSCEELSWRMLELACIHMQFPER